MLDTILAELFNALGAWEIRNARVWLESPFFNRRAEPLRLFDYLVECRKTGQTPDQTAAMRAILGKTDAPLLPKFRHEMSGLAELLRTFLVWQELLETTGQRELLALRVMRKRGLEKNFNHALRETEKTFQKSENQSFARQLDGFRLGMERYQWELRSRRGQDFPLHNLREKLDAWYAGQALHLACMEQSRQAVRRTERDVAAPPDLLENLLEYLPARPHETQPGVALYHLGQRMLAAPEDGERMENFRQLLENQIHTVPTSEARDLLMLAINHGIQRINAGERAAIRRTLDFYRLGLSQKLLHDERGQLTKYTYNNVLMTFLALEEWDNARDFLEQYRADLPAHERENVYHYNLAVFNFRRGDFDGTLELLRDVTFADPMYNLESRKMLLKIYFEQNALDALESLLDNLLNWLRRHGELGYHREMYRNLASFVRRLLRLAPSDADGRKRLEKKVLDTPLVAERKWLLEKIRNQNVQ